jgi:hypothetical protein
MGQRRKQPTEIKNSFGETLVAAREQVMMIVIHDLTHETKELLN